MGGKLEDYFVSIGIKGQNVVLKNIDKIKKESKNLSKLKPMLDMRKGIEKALPLGSLAGIAKVIGSKIIEKKLTSEEEQEKKRKKDEKITHRFSKGAENFVKGTATFASSAATFDPTTVIKSVTSGIGTSLSGISILGVSLGQLPKGIADISNALVDMASGALTIAKQSAEAQYGLTTRKATMEYYGGGGVRRGGMSRAEHAELTMTIASSFGRLQKPMIAELNKLVEKKDTAALRRVAAGDWQSTGTDKGWMLQQITNQTQGLPPSIAQAIQTSLLKSNAELIQDKTREQKYAQSIDAQFKNRAEDQTARLFQVTSAQAGTFATIDANLNRMQVALVGVGVKFSGAIESATSALLSLPKTVEKLEIKLKSAMDKLPESVRPEFKGFGK